MPRRHGPCIVLCLCFLLIGILIGGCIIGSLPGHNRIHLVVMPNQAINIAPEVGDRIYWTTYGAGAKLPITFHKITGSPCGRDSDPSRGECHFTDTRPKNIFLYDCPDAVPCDPGVGPHSGTGGLNTTLTDNFATRLLGTVVFAIDRTLGFLPPPPGTAWPAEGVAQSGQTALEAVRADPYDAGVGCDDNGKAYVDKPNISKAVGDTVSWAGSPFTLKIDVPSDCPVDNLNPDAFHKCTLQANAQVTYRVNDTSCTTPDSDPYTITPK